MVGAIFGCGQDRTFDPQSRQLIFSLYDILVEASLCRDRDDCSNKQYVLKSSWSEGVSITVYGVTDRALVSKFLFAISENYFLLPANAKLTAVFVASTKAEDLKRSFLTKPIVVAEVHFSGAKHAER